ncbi:hypothetical protein J3A83DRAFT_4087373 [Scleroderma citrinum]
MFSGFSSFLPSILQSNSSSNNNSDRPLQNEENILIEPPIPEPHPPSPKKKNRRDKQPNETFIVVRPPPSKSIHPLNLQVQLVPPQSRHASSSTTIHALDSNHSQTPRDSSDLTRTSSERSDYSGYTSATSISSVSSASTTSSTRRTIIPLYNLQAHHVMANTIVDAGTDAKVAKFAKRGLEIIGLATLEPIEVWGAASLPGTFPSTSSARTSVDDHQHREFGALPSPFKSPSPSRCPALPDQRPSSSRSVTLRNGELHQPQQNTMPTINLSLSPTDTAPVDSQPQRKKFFARMFKKKDPSRPLSIAAPDQNITPAVQVTSPLPGTSTARPIPAAAGHHDAIDMTHLHLGFGDSIPSTPMSAITNLSTSAPSTTLCSAVLGVQATLYPPIQPPTGRPTKYVWVVRRWLKGSETGLLNDVIGKLSINGRSVGESNGAQRGLQVEVSFEWVRGRKKERERDRGRKRAAEDHGISQNGVSRSRNGVGQSTPSPSGSVNRTSPSFENRRLSIISQHSTNSEAVTAASECSAIQPQSQHHRRRRSTRVTPAVDDSGDESDPEDSETPWTCTVTIQRQGGTQPSTAINSHSPSPPPSSVSLKVATLSPTPHHPKVVGLLKVPFPLPDIEVEQLAIRKRIITPHGVSRTTGAGPSDLVLTAEDIKDTISSTALWLVVREAFGGVGREKRKGEGWRIRP